MSKYLAPDLRFNIGAYHGAPEPGEIEFVTRCLKAARKLHSPLIRSVITAP